MTRLAAVLGIGGLVAGVLVGYLLWGRANTALRDEVLAVNGRLGEQMQRADQVERRTGELEAQVKVLTDELQGERRLRQQYEALIGRGRK